MKIHLLSTSRADRNMMMALCEQLSFMGHTSRMTAGINVDTSIDALVVLGDRMELLPIIANYVHESVPIIHLHANETTSRSADNKYRAAITSMSDLCLDPIEYGSIGYQLALDANVKQPSHMPDRYALITLHPWLQCPNLDSLLDRIMTHCAEHRLKPFISSSNGETGSITPSLNHVDFGALFYNAMANATVIIGNSSSMIFEAAAYAVPCVLIGPRQYGRHYHSNITHIKHIDMLGDGIKTALESNVTGPAEHFEYRGDYGNPIEATAERIIGWLK